jgi:hypothetical protein
VVRDDVLLPMAVSARFTGAVFRSPGAGLSRPADYFAFNKEVISNSL